MTTILGGYQMNTIELKKRFRSHVKVDPERGCWLWKSSLCKGYATMQIEGNTKRVARWIYELLIKPIPEGHEMHHTCLVKNCVNPFHLQPLDHGDHIRIHAELGAWSGTRNANAKLTDQEVMQIRKFYWDEDHKAEALAEKFGVCERTVYHCINFHTYSDLVPEGLEDLKATIN
jgi:hypothetical protein